MILKDIVSFLRGVTLTRFRGWRAGFALLASLLVSGCASLGVSTPAAVGGELSPDVVAQPVEQPPAEVPAPDPKPLADGLDAPQDEELVDVYPGSGRLFDARRAAQLSGVDLATGDIILNFENADIKEVVHFILGQQLGENYVIHPGLAGTVTLQTSRPLPREALLPTLESLLRINGATLIVGENGVYQVRPREGALRGTSVPRTVPGGPGMGVRIVPLVFIGALEMAKILEPFLTTGALLRVDPVRNLLLLAGSRSELDQWQETIDIFDVDWLAGMSVGVFTLRHAKVGEVVSELERLTDVNNGGPLAGLLQFLPIERINALLVMTSQPRYLEDAKEWVRRLDRAKDVQRTRLHVYRMQHAKAEDVAGLLSQIYGGKETGGASTAAPALAPGLEPAQIGSGNLQSSEGGETTPVATSFGGGEDEVGQLEAGVRIYADNSNNSLLVMASERDYEVLLEGLRELDIPPLQVLVDATIVEVSLTDELRYGIQWFFNNKVGDYRGQGILGDSATLRQTFPGFNYSIVDSASQIRAVLSALATDSMVNVLSSPSIMVLDNQQAIIRVGDQVPIRTTESTSTVTDNPVTVTSIAYRDTGVSLTVTPRVNAGGMVRLDIEQEVNDVTSTTSSDIDSPTIQQRVIRSSVAVQSGETIVLGGLIRENNNRDESGVPGLHKLPLFGPLFGTTSTSSRRTELLVLLTPRVAHNAAEARLITESFRQRMRGLEARVRDASRREGSCGTDATGPC